MSKTKQNNITKLLHEQRKYFERQKRYHYLAFGSFAIILLIDFLVIIYTRAVTLDAYAWAGIILLFTLLAVEAKQYLNMVNEIENIDDFYMRGEYKSSKK